MVLAENHFERTIWKFHFFGLLLNNETFLLERSGVARYSKLRLVEKLIKLGGTTDLFRPIEGRNRSF